MKRAGPKLRPGLVGGDIEMRKKAHLMVTSSNRESTLGAPHLPRSSRKQEQPGYRTRIVAVEGGDRPGNGSVLISVRTYYGIQRGAPANGGCIRDFGAIGTYV